jgi:hypothetical protein
MAMSHGICTSTCPHCRVHKHPSGVPYSCGVHLFGMWRRGGNGNASSMMKPDILSERIKWAKEIDCDVASLVGLLVRVEMK